MALPAPCHRCIELEAQLDRSEDLISQLLGQIRIVAANQHVAEAAVLDYLDSPAGRGISVSAAAVAG